MKKRFWAFMMAVLIFAATVLPALPTYASGQRRLASNILEEDSRYLDPTEEADPGPGQEEDFEISFDTNGGGDLEPIRAKAGSLVIQDLEDQDDLEEEEGYIRLPLAAREGYIFKGWTLEDGQDLPEDFLLEEDIVLIASWEEEEDPDLDYEDMLEPRSLPFDMSTFGFDKLRSKRTIDYENKISVSKSLEALGENRWRVSLVVETDILPEDPNPGGPATPSGPLDIVFVVDASRSMEGSKINNLKTALSQAVDQLIPQSNTGDVRIGLVAYAGDVGKIHNNYDLPVVGLTNNTGRLKTAINQIKAVNPNQNNQRHYGYAFTQGAIKNAREILASSSNEGHIVLLTDSRPSVSYEFNSNAKNNLAGKVEKNTVSRKYTEDSGFNVNDSFPPAGEFYETKSSIDEGVFNYRTVIGFRRQNVATEVDAMNKEFDGPQGEHWVYYNHGNSAIAEASYAKVQNTFWTVGIDSYWDNLNQCATSPSHHKETSAGGIATSLTEITNDLLGQNTPDPDPPSNISGKVIDTIAPGFKIPHQSQVTYDAGKMPYYDSQTGSIVWETGDLFEYRQSGGGTRRLTASYIVEVDNIENASPIYPGSNSYYPSRQTKLVNASTGDLLKNFDQVAVTYEDPSPPDPPPPDPSDIEVKKYADPIDNTLNSWRVTLEVKSSDKNIKIIDPMGDGFDLVDFTSSAYIDNQRVSSPNITYQARTLSWNIGDLGNPGSGEKTYKLVYNVQINDGIQSASPSQTLGNGERLYYIGKNSRLVKAQKGNDGLRTFPNPQVDPVLYQIEVMVQDSEGKPKSVTEDFLISFQAGNSFQSKLIRLEGESQKTSGKQSDLRSTSYQLSHGNLSSSDYDITYYVRGNNGIFQPLSNNSLKLPANIGGGWNGSQPNTVINSLKDTVIRAVFKDNNPNTPDPPPPGQDEEDKYQDHISVKKYAEPIAGKVNQWKMVLEVETDNTIEGQESPSDKTHDIVIVMDASVSMSGNMSSSRIAAKKLVDDLIKGDGKVNIGLVTFAGFVGKESNIDLPAHELTNNKNSLKNKIDLVTPVTRSDRGLSLSFIQGGLRKAGDMLAGSNADKKDIILISDGYATVSYKIRDIKNKRSDQILTKNLSHENGAPDYNYYGYFSRDNLSAGDFNTRNDYNANRAGLPGGYSSGIGSMAWNDQTNINRTPVYHDHGNSAIAQANIIRSNTQGMSIWTVDTGSNEWGQHVLKNVANSEEGHYFPSTGNSQINALVGRIQGRQEGAISQNIKAKVIDPIASGFKIPHGSSVSNHGGTGLPRYDFNNQALVWDLGDLFEMGQTGDGKKLFRASYYVEVDEGTILSASPSSPMENLYYTNGNARVVNVDDNDADLVNFPKPEVEPVIIRAKNQVQDLSGQEISGSDSSFISIRQDATGQTIGYKTFSQAGEETSFVNIKDSGSYTARLATSNINVSYLVNGAESPGGKFTIGPNTGGGWNQEENKPNPVRNSQYFIQAISTNPSAEPPPPPDPDPHGDSIRLKKYAQPVKQGCKDLVNTWDITLEVEADRASLPNKNHDIVLVIDASSSMGGGYMDQVKDAANKLVDELVRDNPAKDVKIGIVTFASHVGQNNQGLKLPQIAPTNNASALKSTISQIQPVKESDYPHRYTLRFTQGGLKAARDMLEASGATSKNMVLLSDGYPNMSYALKDNAQGHIKDLVDTSRQINFNTKIDNVSLRGYHTKDNIPEDRFDYNSNYVDNPIGITFINWEDIRESLHGYGSIIGSPLKYWNYIKPGEGGDGRGDVYFNHENSTIAEAKIIKNKGIKLWSVAMGSDDIDFDTIRKVASSEDHYFPITEDEMNERVLGDIVKDIGRRIDDNKGKIIDPLGHGFSLVPGSLRTYIDNNEVLGQNTTINSEGFSWNLGNLIEEGGGTKTFKATYRIEINNQLKDARPSSHQANGQAL